MPTLAPELTRAERIAPISAKPSGKLIAVDAGIFTGILETANAAIAAVERGNNRAAGVKAERACLKARFETGVTPTGC